MSKNDAKRKITIICDKRNRKHSSFPEGENIVIRDLPMRVEVANLSLVDKPGAHYLRLPDEVEECLGEQFRKEDVRLSRTRFDAIGDSIDIGGIGVVARKIKKHLESGDWCAVKIVEKNWHMNEEGEYV